MANITEKHFAFLDALRKQKKLLAQQDAQLMQLMANEFAKLQENLADRLELAVRAVSDMQAQGLPVNPGKLYQVQH
jgi:hypothetical protein